MVEIVKWEELTASAVVSLVVKVTAILCLLLTIFFSILTIHYTGSGIDAVLTYSSFNEVLTLNQGTGSSVPTNISPFFLNSLFILAVITILITILLLFLKKNFYSGITNALGLLLLGILVLYYYILIELNGQTHSGISFIIIINLGYYFLLLAWVVLFLASFIKFEIKDTSPPFHSSSEPT